MKLILFVRERDAYLKFRLSKVGKAKTWSSENTGWKEPEKLLPSRGKAQHSEGWNELTTHYLINWDGEELDTFSQKSTLFVTQDMKNGEEKALLL